MNISHESRMSARRVLMMMVLLLIIAGCGGKPVMDHNNLNDEQEQNENEQQVNPSEEEPPVIQPEPEPEPEPEEKEPPFTYPLTGIGTEEEITARPYVVLVENSPAARPQSGLHQADIVYEILAEGPITRFVTVFQSEKAEIIGPVRSARPYFVKLGDAMDALFVHAGWSQAAMNILAERKMQHFDAVYGDHMYYWRSDDRVAPHNLYTSSELIQKGAEKKGYRTDQWNKVEIKFRKTDEAIVGEKAISVAIPYIGSYEVSYEYYEPEGRYYRFMNGEAHKDKETDQQLVADNILIGYTPHRILDDVGRREVNVDGPGEGILVQKGIARKITWEQQGGMIRAFQNGEELELVPGKTWIHMVPMNSQARYE